MPAEAPLVLHAFSTFAIGGPQVRFAAIANRLGQGCRHAVMAMDGNIAARERLNPGLDIRFPAIPVRKGDTLGNLRRFIAALVRLRPDILVTYNWGAIEWVVANALARRRHVHVEDGFGPDEQSGQKSRRVLARRLGLRSATVVLPSRTLLRVAGEVWRLPQRRLRYVPNGIDLARFAPGDAGPPPWPRDLPVIGTLAALRPEKNLARLLRAFALLRRRHAARLVIVGDGPERPALEALAGSLGLADDVRFAGHMADPPLAYRNFDVFALSSDTEQMPLSLLEAMGSALPVAATDVGDVAAMLPEAQRGFVAAREDAALAEALGALLAAPALRRDLGEANRRQALAQFDQEAMVAAWAGLFGIDPQAGRA